MQNYWPPRNRLITMLEVAITVGWASYTCMTVHTCMGLMHKFTITHPSVVAVTTATQVHVSLSTTVVNIEVVNQVICYQLSRVTVIEETSQVNEHQVL